ELRRGIGYVIQGVGLFPHMTVRGNIAYVPTLSGKRTSEERLRELLDIVRLDAAFLDRYPHELSGGQKQRVGLARALAAQPQILLMDEPFGAVDDITRKALQASIKHIHHDLGMTIFFITHDINEALNLGSRVMVLNKGRIEQIAPPESILGRPATPYVKALLDSASCTWH
ncbi:MAG: ATP-binding cassette domain-containing protein, partial [Deltaproteobacteria bacterium]|nr:ATP-binding cassette domain-containing protein [Deltaproteobacteria bacterium]